MPKVISAASATAAENARLRKIDSGSSGPGDQCSTAKKAAESDDANSETAEHGRRAPPPVGPFDEAQRQRPKRDNGQELSRQVEAPALRAGYSAT